MENAKQYFELTDEEKDTILRHMWPLTPVPPSTRAGYAVTFADKMCCLEETKATVKRYAAVPGHLLFAQTAERGKLKDGYMESNAGKSGSCQCCSGLDSSPGIKDPDRLCFEYKL